MIVRKKILTSGATLLGIAAVVAIPSVVIPNALSTSTSFDPQAIGVYCEKQWKPAYELAVKKYNAEGHKHPIQLKENGSFDALGLVETLGYQDQKVADLLYMPLDRIPSLVQDQQALMGFATPQALLGEYTGEHIDDPSTIKPIISTDVTGTSEDDINAYAKTGQAVVESADGKLRPYYFGISHATEALILFNKGYTPDELKNTNVMNLVDAAATDGWKTQMVSFEFKNLWSGLGVIAGFVEKQVTGAGVNGQNVGRLIVTKNSLSSKYQSNFTRINDLSNVSDMQNPDQIEGWDSKGVSCTLEQGSTAFKNAVDYVTTFYKKTVPLKNPNLGGEATNDWLIGTEFGKTQGDLFRNPDIKKGVVVDGPWAKDSLKGDNVHVSPMISLDSNNTPYLQAPGGWLYAINQRNWDNPSKVNDIKSFVNILLSDPEVINMEYQTAGKIIDGKIAKTTLESDLKGFDKEVLDAVYASTAPGKRMNARPDGGNSDFGQAWSMWDGDGWTSAGAKTILKDQTINESELNKMREILITSANSMIDRLKKK